MSGLAPGGAWHLLDFLMGPFVTFNCLFQFTTHGSVLLVLLSAFLVPGEPLAGRCAGICSDMVLGFGGRFYLSFLNVEIQVSDVTNVRIASKCEKSSHT